MYDEALSRLAALARKINTLRAEGHTALAESLAQELPEVQVYPALWNKAYGGCQEGGWWYDTYVPVTKTPYQRELLQMRLDRAMRWIVRLNALTDSLINCHRKGPDTSVSEGHYVYLFCLGEPVAEPRVTPRYE
jgi:hypothetical protein